MLLSIDRVLQLIAEGKSIKKIAELSNVSEDDVCSIVEKARKILLKYDKSRIIRKIKLDKIRDGKDEEDSDKNKTNSTLENEIFQGAELTAVPVDSTLTMYVDGAAMGNPGPSGIGIVINDSDGRQVGKVSHYLGHGTNNYAEYSALIRALQIAIFFKTRLLNVRSDSELVVRQVSGESRVSSKDIKPLYDKVVSLKKKIKQCKIEHVTLNMNDKADYLAKKSIANK